MAERPPVADLRGGKTSEDSFSRLMIKSTVEDTVDIRADLFMDAALGLTV